jgi:hypothetical protein
MLKVKHVYVGYTFLIDCSISPQASFLRVYELKTLESILSNTVSGGMRYS